jgi:hypothetical protein
LAATLLVLLGTDACSEDIPQNRSEEGGGSGREIVALSVMDRSDLLAVPP